MGSIVDILPLEVIEHIIDLLAVDEHYKSGPHEPFQFPTVKACALTCKAFYPRSSYQRFRAIKVYDENPYVYPVKGSVYLDEFERFVTTHPEEASHVLELHYSLRGKAYRPKIDDAVPQNLTNLQSLVFSPYRGTMDWAYYVPWQNPRAREKKDPLMQILHLPTLTSFKLSRTTNFRPSDLFLCTNLKSLSLQSVSVWPDDDDRLLKKPHVPISNPVSIRLRHLEVGGSGINTAAGMLEPVASEDCPVLDLQDLKELTIKGGIQPKYFLSTEKIFKQVPQLESLRLEVGRRKSESGVKYYIPMITERLNTLRSLYIDLYLTGPTDNDDDDPYDGDPLGEDHFESLMATLLFFMVRFSGNKLKSLQVQIRFGPTYIGCRSDEEWATIARMFTLQGTWPALTHFDLALIVQGKEFNRRFIVERLSRLPETHLSELSSQNFTFTFFCGKEGEYVPRTMEY